MSRFQILRRAGGDSVVVAESSSIELQENFMGECFVTVSVKSPRPIAFAIGDYIIYRGNEYTLNYEPTVEKTSSRDSIGDAFVYENMKFSSLNYELVNCEFKDVVLSDNNMHYTALGDFSFFCEDVNQLADRIKANLIRVYGENSWDVKVAGSVGSEQLYYEVKKKDIVLSFSGNNCWEALSKVYTEFGLYFTISGRTITIGSQNSKISNTFQQGIDKGLVSIESTSDSSQAIITRLYAYGNETNLPKRYYFRYNTTLAYTSVKSISDGTYSVSFRISWNSGTRIPSDSGTCTIKSIGDTSFKYTLSDGNRQLKLIGLSYSDAVNVNARGVGSIVAFDGGRSRFDILSSSGVDSEIGGGRFSIKVTLGDKMASTAEDRSISLTMMRNESYTVGGTCNGDVVTISTNTSAELANIKAWLTPNTQVYVGNYNKEVCPTSAIIADKTVIPNNMSIIKLMLPGFPEQSLKEYVDKLLVSMNAEYTNSNTSSARRAEIDYLTKLYPKCNYSDSPQNPYIESKNAYKIGIKEGSVSFDGSNNLEDIYPTIEDITAEDMKAAGIEVTSTGLLNVVLAAQQLKATDKGGTGIYGDDEKSYAKVWVQVKDMGFDWSTIEPKDSDATIHFKTGMCAGREFSFSKSSVEKITENNLEKYDGAVKEIGSWIIEIEQKEDSSLGLFFPYCDYNIHANDTFVITGIELQESYVKAASQRVLRDAVEYILDNDYTRKAYNLNVDNAFMAEQHMWHNERGEVSLYENISAGMSMPLKDGDIDIDESIIIAQLTIKEDCSSNIPQYSITLNDEPSVGTIQKIQNEISAITRYVYGSSASSSVSVGSTVNLIKSTDEKESSDDTAYSSKRSDNEFLNKKNDDIAHGKITFEKGFDTADFVKDSSGSAIYKDEDGNWHLQADYLKVTKKFQAEEVEIMQTSHIGGKLMNTAANCKIVRVDELPDAYVCYFKKKDDDGSYIYNMFKAGDLAYCETFNLMESDGTLSNHYFWRLITAVDDNTDSEEDLHYIVLSKTDCDKASDAPMEGDSVVQLGNTEGSERQGAIIQSAAGNGSPYFRIYKGITTYKLPTPKIDLSPDNVSIEANSIKLMNKETGESESVADKIASIDTKLVEVANQADESFQVWRGETSGKPNSKVEPESNWKTEADKASHINDYYIDSDGLVYQYLYQNNSYQWVQVSDELLIKATTIAKEKVRNFIAQPSDEAAYDIGDVWHNATYPADGSQYDNDVLVCINAKESGWPFNISDWQLASKYTDDTKAEEVESQLEITNGKIDAFVKKVTFDDDGNVSNINKSGLVVESDYAKLFAQEVTNNKLVNEASVTTAINDGISNATIQADKINFIGKTIINDNFVVDNDGNLSINGKITTSEGGKLGNLTINKNGALEGGGQILTTNNFSPYIFVTDFDTNDKLKSRIKNIIVNQYIKSSDILLSASKGGIYSLDSFYVVNLPTNEQMIADNMFNMSFYLRLICFAPKYYTSDLKTVKLDIKYRILSNNRTNEMPFGSLFVGLANGNYYSNGEIIDNDGGTVGYIDMTDGDVLELYHISNTGAFQIINHRY